MSKKKIEIIVSPKFAFVAEDFKKVVKNALVFFWPVIAVAFAELLNFIPEQVDPKFVALSLWTVNTVFDGVRKWAGVAEYKK